MVSWYVEWYKTWKVTRCEIWWMDYCGGEECGICNVPRDCCVISDVEKDAICCNVRCGGVLIINSRCVM